MFKSNKTERPTQLRPFGVFGVRVKKDFTCEGYRFRAGTLVSVNNELVQRILAEQPHYFETP